MDDQLARCKIAEEEGWGIVVSDRTQVSITKGCDDLMSKKELHQYQPNQINGADELSLLLLRGSNE